MSASLAQSFSAARLLLGLKPDERVYFMSAKARADLAPIDTIRATLHNAKLQHQADLYRINQNIADWQTAADNLTQRINEITDTLNSLDQMQENTRLDNDA